MAPDPADLVALRKCEGADCTYAVNNAVTEVKDVLQAMSNHIAAMHPSSGGSEGGGAGGGSKNNAAIPALEEDVTLIQWEAWLARFQRWQLACKISDKSVEN